MIYLTEIVEKEGIDPEKLEKLQDLLQDLERSTDLEGCAVVTREGMRIACSVSTEMDADVFSAISAVMNNLGDMTIDKMAHGGLQEVIVSGTSGFTILTNCGKDRMLVGASRKTIRLGFSIHTLRRAAQRIMELLE